MDQSGISPVNWRITGGRRVRPAPFLVAGIVNITPDSFSDGGAWFSPEAALERARVVAAEGAAIVDLGAESTRPGADDIGQDEEWRRLEPVLEGTLRLRANLALAGARPEEGGPLFAVSIDTFRAGTAALALALGRENPDAGADIINDVSGGAFDPAMAEVLAEFKPGYVLGHSPDRPAVMQRCPRYTDVVDELLQWFDSRMAALIKAGLPEACICLDPCIGFGKTLEHNLAICAAAPRLARLGRPLWFGVSRKSFLVSLLERSGHDSTHAQSRPDMRERDIATQAAVALLARSGVAVHRVHQVADTVATLAVVRGMGK